MKTPFKQLITIDFETFWDSKEYTLSKMTTEEYIRDERFKAFGACIHEYGSDKITQWYRASELPRILSCYPQETTAVLAHNAQFDVSILSWIFDWHPCFVFDSLSMARALRGVEVGNSLMKLAEHYNLPAKGKAVHSTNGVRKLGAVMEKELAEYCKHDVFLCERVFNKLVQFDHTPYEAGEYDVDTPDQWAYPKKELRLIDMTLKMYTLPQLELDSDMLRDAIVDERTKRETLLTKLNVDETDLASNPKFAAVLETLGVPAPRKTSKTTGRETLALAKNDALFQALLNGEREDIAALCEARLRVKSTTERTRAQRFLDISRRGALPVPLSYYGASTGRWTASKGSAINMQNLKRGSFLRKAIMAPEGYELIVGDLSQIEPRVLAWLSDYEDLLDVFRSGADAYAAFGAQMFNIPGLTKDSHPDLRQSAKSALLGCFGADTPVLTNRGWVPIVQVQATDMVWDGEEWVCHQGVVPQGEKEVLTALGISATSDHEILTEHGWAEWSEVLANLSLLQSALLSATLPVSNGGVETAGTTQSCGVSADGKDSLIVKTSLQEEAHGAVTAHIKQRSTQDTQTLATKKSAQTESIESACLTVSAQSSHGAQTQTVSCTQTTVGEASLFTRLGLKIVSSFSSTWSRLKDGTNLRYNSTVSTTTKATNHETSASSAEASTWGTSGALAHVVSKSLEDGSQPLKQRMQTYDIGYAGPRNRYTVLTSHGPLVVHNCGYGLGWASFAAQLLVGFLGAPPVRYDKAFAKKLGVTPAYVQKFLDWPDNIKKMEEIAHVCTTEELVIHCVAAKKIIDIYRATAHPVTAMWDLFGHLIQSSLHDGKEYNHKGCVLFKKGEIILPSGMSLLYPDLRREPEINKETKKPVRDRNGNVIMNWVYGEDATKLYAGKVTNNVTQGVARCVMTDGMLRTSKRYFVAGTVHDEQIAIAPKSEAKEAYDWMLSQMTVEPKYMPGIPLAADGGHHRRYGLAKN